MAQLTFSVVSGDYARLAPFGKDHILARLARGDADSMGFPLFLMDKKDHASGSPFFDPVSAQSRIAMMNPDLPPPPREALYVIAGQQPGLLSGPLYTFLKAAGVVALARKLSETWDSPVLPLFWVASEDHDVMEVNRVFMNNKRYVHHYEGDIRRGKVPQVAAIPLEGAREPLLEYLDQALPRTEFTPWVLDAVGSADYSNYATAFSSLMQDLFSQWPLRIVDAPALRPLTAPVLSALVQMWPKVQTAFDEGMTAVRSHGFEPPLKNAGVFEIVDGNRVALEFKEKTVLLDKGETSFSEAAKSIRTWSADYSPNAALRPILQDAVLPIAATLAGPTELLYLWQVRPIYDVVKVKPSYLLPRPSATFVEAKIRKAAEKADLEMDRILNVNDAVEKVISQKAEEEVKDPRVAALEEKSAALFREMDGLLEDSGSRWLQKSREAMASKMEKVLRRLREEQASASNLDRSRLQKIADAVLPEGKLQERQLNVLQFINLYGPDFVKQAVERLDPLSPAHQVVGIEVRAEKGE